MQSLLDCGGGNGGFFWLTLASLLLSTIIASCFSLSYFLLAIDEGSVVCDKRIGGVRLVDASLPTTRKQ
jgi:hypothetical protein